MSDPTRGEENADHPGRNRRRSTRVTDHQAQWLAHHLHALVQLDPLTWATSDLTLSQLMALHIISARCPLSLNALSEELGTRPPATCAMVDRLTRAGLVRRTPDPDDHRRIQIQTTDKASLVLGHIELDTARRAQTVLNAMSDTARRRLSDTLTHTARHLAR